jgi:hypothetical protein
MHARSFRPSPAMVVAVIALVAAMSGTGWALVRNSVGTKQLKNRAVTAVKIRKNAIRSAHVKDGSLLRRDFAAGVLPDPVVVTPTPTPTPTPTTELTDFELAFSTPVTSTATVQSNLPADKTFLLSEVVFQNPSSDIGRIHLRRDGSTLLQLSLSNFSTHHERFDTPLRFKPGEKVELFVDCDNPSSGCTPSALVAGVLTN